MQTVIKKEHKGLLKTLGLKEEDFRLFDGKSVTYEYDGEKGVRIYDPYCMTSYNEYIDVDGWSSWSSEQDTFMTDILKDARARAEASEKISRKPSQKEMAEAMMKKFGKVPPTDSRS